MARNNATANHYAITVIITRKVHNNQKIKHCGLLRATKPECKSALKDRGIYVYIQKPKSQ